MSDSKFSSYPGIHPLLQGQRIVRRRAFSGLAGPAARSGGTDGAFPSPDGSPGSLVYPYGERSPIYGDSGQGGGPLSVTSPPVLDLTNTPVPAPPVDTGTTSDGLSVPFGASLVPWANPTTLQSVPIVASTPANQPVLSLNLKRNLLLIQNNSSATGAGNTAPTFYIGFNSQAQVGLSLALLPGGAGVLYDIICPRDSVYITIAGGVGIFTVAGVVQQGTYAPLGANTAQGFSGPGVGNASVNNRGY